MKAAAVTQVGEPPPPPARPSLEATERTHLQERIRSEIDRRRPRPVARRTLELLAAASVEPAGSELGYRIVDRFGAQRLRDVEGSEPVPLVLADLVDAIHDQHPALFLPPEPEPEPQPAQVAEPKESALMVAATEVRAATTRFVEAQSERAQSLAERSSMQGRAMAHSAAGRFAGLKDRLTRGLRRQQPVPAESGLVASSTPAPDEGAGETARSARGSDAASAWNARVGWLGEAVRHRLHRLREGRIAGWGATDTLHRRWVAAGSAAVLVAIAGAGLVIATRPPPGGATQPIQGDPPAASTPRPAPSPPAEPVVEAPQPDTASPPPEIENRAAGEPRPPAEAPPANAVTGPAQVIDTATLRVNGKLMRLFGVEWVRGGQAEDLTKYLAGRPITCQPGPGSENFLCQVEGRDLSEVVLFNGGGRASSEATPELVAAEDHARTERIGVWKR